MTSCSVSAHTCTNIERSYCAVRMHQHNITLSVPGRSSPTRRPGKITSCSVRAHVWVYALTKKDPSAQASKHLYSVSAWEKFPNKRPGNTTSCPVSTYAGAKIERSNWAGIKTFVFCFRLGEVPQQRALEI